MLSLHWFRYILGYIDILNIFWYFEYFLHFLVIFFEIESRNTRAFLSNTFINKARLKLAKNQAKAKQQPEAKLLLLENYSLSSSMLSFKNNRSSKKCATNKYVCLNEVIWLMAMNMRLKMKNRSHRYDINRLRPRHGHKFTKYEMCLSKMMVICIKQHLSNIWSSILERDKQHWGWVEKSVTYKKVCNQ